MTFDIIDKVKCKITINKSRLSWCNIRWILLLTYKFTYSKSVLCLNLAKTKVKLQQNYDFQMQLIIAKTNCLELYLHYDDFITEQETQATLMVCIFH